MFFDSSESVLAGIRARAAALRAHSRELRGHSAAVMARREAALQRLEIRRELIRSRYAQPPGARVDAAEPLLPAQEERELSDWMCAQVLEMIGEGWGVRELAEVGIGPAMLRELGLEGHPALPPPDTRDDDTPSPPGMSPRR